MSTETPFVSLEDIATHFAVSPSTMRLWVRKGIVPKDTYLKIGQTYRFNLSKVVAALTSAPKQLELDLDATDGATNN